MHVVMYKLLAYIYDCMKKGEEPRARAIAHDGDMLSIPYPYWASIVKSMVDRGYVDGFVVTEAMGGDLIVNAYSPRVTLEGVEFLQENSMMAKALAFLKETKASLPFL